MELLSSSILMFSSSFILELPALFGSFKMELLESLFCSCQKLQFAIDCYLVTHPKIKQPCLFAALRLSNMLVTSAKTKGRLSGGSTSSLPKANPSPNGGLQKAQVSTHRPRATSFCCVDKWFPTRLPWECLHWEGRHGRWAALQVFSVLVWFGCSQHTSCQEGMADGFPQFG